MHCPNYKRYLIPSGSTLLQLPFMLLTAHNVCKIFKLLKNQTDYHSFNSICRQFSKCEFSKIPLLWEAVVIEWSTAVTMFGGSLVKNVQWMFQK